MRKVLTVCLTLLVLLVVVPPSVHAAPLAYYGGDVANSPRVYITFWGKNWSLYPGARSALREMYEHVSGSGWHGILSQYGDGSGPISKTNTVSSWTDETINAPGSVNDENLVKEIEYAISQRGWPGAGTDNQYVVFPAPGSGYTAGYVKGCGQHRWSSKLSASFVYVGWPNDPEFYDPEFGSKCDVDPSGLERAWVSASVTASHEYAESVVNPAGTQSGKTMGWTGATNIEQEIGNACFLAPEAAGMVNGSWVQKIWDNQQNKCWFGLDDTHTTVETVGALNGNPGWFSIKGHVTGPGVPISEKTINVDLFKWNTSTSDWDLKATLPATVTNGAYEIKNWEGVGPGGWVAIATFPQQGSLRASSSVFEEGDFEVKDGYQLISTVSNKCADVQYSSLENGAPVWQFGCWSPVRAGQVFWIKPISGPYVQLINKNSKKCMETRNVSQTAGETMQQWSCGWLAQESQLWQKVDVAGGSKFVVKHSGQCLDLYLSGTQDGNKIDQHPCNGTNAQVWQVKSVNSEPAKPEVFLTISGVQPGQPGFFDISGNVKQGDYPVNGKPVFIDFERLVGSVWQKEPGLTKEVKADSTGYYVLVNNFVGRGTYRAHARLNSELPLLGGAESGNHQFQIGMGYRLASKLAPNKCLSVNNGSWNQGAPILLWDCSPNPQGGDGQVITWSPVNGIWPHRQIVFNGSKLCLDVPGVKQDDGLQLQQWACNVAGQDNQLWTGSGGEYQEFRVKHSGKCIDLWFSGTQNGNKIDQHACNGTNAQKWKFQYIP